MSIVGFSVGVGELAQCEHCGEYETSDGRWTCGCPFAYSAGGDFRIDWHPGCESPECPGAGYVFDLAHEDSGVSHYSEVYATLHEAVEAADAWEREQDNERDAMGA